MIQIQENISLKNFTTFQIGGLARYFVVVKNMIELNEAIIFSREKKLPFFVLGGGSNILVSDSGYSGLVIKNEILDKKIEGNKLIVGSGECLDEIIQFALDNNLSGLENLSGIPGTVGGAVVQNAGAYGVETKDCLYSVSGVDTFSGQPFLYKNNICQFGYRESVFKNNKNLVITEVEFELNDKFSPHLEYSGLKNILGGGKLVRTGDVREAVLKIRGEKLPDWRKTGTAGSFFKNPVISESDYDLLRNKFSQLPGFTEKNERMKVPLAWVLDNICGLKGYKEGNVGLYDKQPLILINLGGATSNEIENFSNKVKNIVKEKTGIEIQEEVEKIKL